jgi:hypothetical protein
MRLALGLSVHTGWATCVLAGGSAEAIRSVARVSRDAVARATGVMKRLTQGREVAMCAIVAKSGTLAELDVVIASHPRIHTSEGLFYRDVLLAAAQATGLRTRLVPPGGHRPERPASRRGRSDRRQALEPGLEAGLAGRLDRARMSRVGTSGPHLAARWDTIRFSRRCSSRSRSSRVPRIAARSRSRERTTRCSSVFTRRVV